MFSDSRVRDTADLHTNSDEHAPRQHYNITLGVLCLAALSFALSQTLVVPALPSIQKQLHTDSTTVTFVLTAFLVSASVATPIVGRLGDIFGKERMLLITLTIFAAGSLTAALSHTIGVLILGRVIQGVAGAVFPLSFGIIRDEFPPERVATAIGLISATFGIGGGGGLVLSGVIVDHLNYEWIFWLGLAAVSVAIVATRMFVPESPVKTPSRVDVFGAALMAGALVSLLIGVSRANEWGWTSARTLGLFATSAILSVLWVVWEHRVSEPLVDMRMMRRRAVLTTNLTAMLIGFGMFSSFIMIPQFVSVPASAGYGFGASVTEAGLFLLPSALVMLFAGPVAGALGTRFGSKLPLMAGTAISSSAFLWLALAHSQKSSIYGASALLGVGIGFGFAAMANLVVEAVDPTETGIATGINTIMRTIGGSIGGEVAATIVAGHMLPGLPFPAESGFTTAFVMSACGSFAAFLLASAIPGRRRTADALAATA
jgi:EmrB/QacA subfamily drug resistance transporter